jgi:hypothetical protein
MEIRDFEKVTVKNPENDPFRIVLGVDSSLLFIGINLLVHHWSLSPGVR